MARSDKRKGPAEDALIEAAERIFGTQGIEHASLRAIAQAAGSANSFAVQYHFGDREGLVQAIFERRLAEIEARRRALLRAGEPETIAACIDIIYRPLVEQRDSHGRHSYAGFLLGLRHTDAGLQPRLARAGQAPLAAKAVARMRTLLPMLDDAEFAFRVNAISGLLLDMLGRFDAGDAGTDDQDVLLRRLIVSAAAIMGTAP